MGGTTLPGLLGLPTEGKVVNLLYEPMDKLPSRQGAIQKKLARRHLNSSSRSLTGVFGPGF
jgi:hypothetical protein